MCGVCGCGKGTGAERHDHSHGSGHDHGDHHERGHGHDHAHDHAHAHSHDHDHAQRRIRLVKVERDILEKNDRFAAQNRRLFASTRTLALNLVSSPGSGKTSLLVRTLQDLAGKMPMSVIEGDQQTSLDADRIKETGAPALQINTGKMCHLDASMISEAMGQLAPPAHGVLFVENVGNLVCPAGFDLGEAGKVVLASVTEGEDKPLKYPDMFHAARVVLVTKTDLLPHLELDIAALEKHVRQVNPRTDIVRISTKTGEGLDAWYRWIDERRREVEAA